MQITSRHRTGALFNGLALGVLIAILALVALVTKPPPPPNVAEFAPQAVEQIVDAPSNQSSRFGSGAGEGASGTADLPSSGQRTISTAARVHRCVGNPPRQIEDPQSPPCVAQWEGNNGGATWKGVTPDTIRVVVYGSRAIPVEEQTRFAEFFNRRFEFYGRKLQLVRSPIPSNPSPVEQRAQAAKVDEEYQAFASLRYLESQDNASGPYYDELARRKILSVDTQSSWRTEGKDYGPHDPFQWHMFTLDKFQKDQAEWICNTLAGKTASHGGAEVQNSRRVFGIILEKEPGGVADVTELIQGLDRCGSKPRTVVEYPPGDSMIAKLKADGVTSVICFCDLHSAASWASNGGYQPEWILTPDQDDPYVSSITADQRTHLFGLGTKNKVNGLEERPWYWAAREADPEYRDPGNDSLPIRDYLGFLFLASGIQMAGPNLTPYSFRDGLLKTKFPNPGCAGPPYYQACVGIQAGDHSFFRDLAMVWWNDLAEPPSRHNAGSPSWGAWCYVGVGARYGPGQWPADDQPFFDQNQPCR